MNALPTPRHEETFAIACDSSRQRSAIRRRFMERLELSLQEAGCRGYRVALFLVGIDRSSGVAAALEPGAVESLIERVGERLVRCTGETEGPARLRHDVFALLLPRFRSGAQVREAAARMLGVSRLPFQASIGIAMFPTDGVRSATLIRCAAAALANARREDRPSYSFYLPFFAATSAASASPDL